MSTVVVYESMFGATKAVAEAVGETIAQGGPVRVVEVGELAADPAGLGDDVTLLVVGGPTHAFSMSRASTREDAAREAGPVISARTGVREWLADLSLPAGLPVAAFDTKVVKPNLPGSAAKSIDKHLRRLGAAPVTRPRTFLVHGKADGLVDGQLDEARAWAATLDGTVATR